MPGGPGSLLCRWGRPTVPVPHGEGRVGTNPGFKTKHSENRSQPQDKLRRWSPRSHVREHNAAGDRGRSAFAGNAPSARKERGSGTSGRSPVRDRDRDRDRRAHGRTLVCRQPGSQRPVLAGAPRGGQGLRGFPPTDLHLTAPQQRHHTHGAGPPLLKTAAPKRARLKLKAGPWAWGAQAALAEASAPSSGDHRHRPAKVRRGSALLRAALGAGRGGVRSAAAPRASLHMQNAGRQRDSRQANARHQRERDWSLRAPGPGCHPRPQGHGFQAGGADARWSPKGTRGVSGRVPSHTTPGQTRVSKATCLAALGLLCQARAPGAPTRAPTGPGGGPHQVGSSPHLPAAL